MKSTRVTEITDPCSFQTIVASIASDQNVWEAVFKNEALQGYLQSQKTSKISIYDYSPPLRTICTSFNSFCTFWLATNFSLTLAENVADDDSQNLESRKEFTGLSDDASESGSTASSPIEDIVENIKHSVVEMANNAYNFVQNMFGFSGENSTEASAEKNAQPSFFNNAMGASFMALAVMVIMMVVLKRA